MILIVKPTSFHTIGNFATPDEGIQAVVKKIHNSLFGLKLRKTTHGDASIYPVIQLNTQLLTSFCEAMSGFVKLLSPKDEIWVFYFCLEPFIYGFVKNQQVLCLSNRCHLGNHFLSNASKADEGMCSSSTFHIYPPGLRKMASQNRRKKLRRNSSLTG